MASEIDAGRARVRAYLDNSALVQGLRVAQNSLQGFGNNLAKIGTRMTGVGDVLGLTVGKEFAGKLISVVGGATIGTAIAAPLVLALNKILSTSGATGLVMGLLKLRDEVAVVIDEMASALIPPLTLALSIVNGIVSAAGRWMGHNRGLVKTGAQIASTVASIGASLALIGKTISVAGSGFGTIATIVTAVGGFLATPLGITVAIAAAIAAAVVAWMKFTASGQAAAQFLLDVFGPTIEAIMETLSGIGDALTSGNLELAGQIAVTALQLLFQSTLNAISDMIGGVLGAALGDVGTRLIQGDLAGAWQTTVQGMAALWDQLAAGIVTAFASAIDLVQQHWTTAIAAMQTTLAGIAQALSGLGFEKAAAGVRSLQTGVGIAGAGGERGLPVIKSAAEGLAKTLQEKARASADDFNKRIADGPNRDDRERELRERLAGLNERANKERAGMKGLELPGGGAADVAKVAVGFSGAALAMQLQGGGQSPQKQMVAELKQQKTLLEQAVDQLGKIKEKLKPFGITT